MTDDYEWLVRTRDALARKTTADAVQDAKDAGVQFSDEETEALRAFWRNSFPVSFVGTEETTEQILGSDDA